MVVKILRLVAVLAAGAVLAVAATTSSPARAEGKVIRLAVVNTPHFSGLIDYLLEEFRKSSGYEVAVYSGSDVYDKARAGGADIVISHYGKAEVERFVLDGYGAWPRTVFSNQLVIAGPKADPAGIRGMTNATEAFAKIAKARAPWVANELPGITYVTNILWDAAGKPDKTGWYDRPGVAKGQAIGYAEQAGAYVVWGALPFLRYKAKHTGSQMEIMVSADPLLHRVMAAVVVRPDKVPGVNVEGAEALQTYLLTPEVQARIAAFRSAGSDAQLWWPAARNNASEGLDE